MIGIYSALFTGLGLIVAFACMNMNRNEKEEIFDEVKKLDGVTNLNYDVISD